MQRERIPLGGKSLPPARKTPVVLRCEGPASACAALRPPQDSPPDADVFSWAHRAPGSFFLNGVTEFRRSPGAP